jgi:hypothetical protein
VAGALARLVTASADAWASVREWPLSIASGESAEFAAVSFDGMKGIRYALRNFTALSVKEHLRSQIEQTGSGAELTPNEVELVRFAADRSDRLNELADRSPGK